MKIPIGPYIKLLSKYLKNLKGQVLLLGVLLAGSVGLQLINPQIIRYFIDKATKNSSSKELTIAALIFIAAAIVQQFMAICSTYISQNVGWISTNALREELLGHCVNLDMSFHKSRQPGEIIERVDGDITALFNFFSKLILNLLNNSILLIGTLVLLFREDFRVGTALTIFAIIAVIILWRIQNIAVPFWVKNREMNAKFYGYIGEQIANTEDIRSSGAVDAVMYRFYEFLKKWFPIKQKANIMGSTMWITTLGVFAVGNAVAFGISGYLWTKGIISIGTVYLIFNYTELLTRPLEQIRSQLEDLQKAGASIARVEELFKIKTKIKEGISENLPSGALDVRVNDVDFKYDDDNLVLNNISLHIKPGKVLGVLGRTGSGKTTLARLLVRLYDPQKGEIKIGNCDLKDVHMKSIREKVAYVTQDVQFFQASLRDNMTFFDKSLSDDNIINALQDVGMKEWFDSLTNGLDTILNSKECGLSAGQAQLLAFGRVFLKNPGFIILDEASSRLDPITEQLVEKAIDKLLKNRSCIIIAHHLWTVQRADDILILNEGGILEYGDREALSKDSSSNFYKLLKSGMEEVLA